MTTIINIKVTKKIHCCTKNLRMKTKNFINFEVDQKENEITPRNVKIFHCGFVFSLCFKFLFFGKREDRGGNRPYSVRAFNRVVSDIAAKLGGIRLTRVVVYFAFPSSRSERYSRRANYPVCMLAQ